MTFVAVLLFPAWDMNQPFVQGFPAVYVTHLLSHLVAVLVIRSAVSVYPSVLAVRSPLFYLIMAPGQKSSELAIQILYSEASLQ